MTALTTRRIRSGGLPLALLACMLAAAVPARAQSISGASASTSGSTGNSGDSDGSIRSSVATQINNGTTFKTRFAWNFSADVGVASTRDSNGTAKHNLVVQRHRAGRLPSRHHAGARRHRAAQQRRERLRRRRRHQQRERQPDRRHHRRGRPQSQRSRRNRQRRRRRQHAVQSERTAAPQIAADQQRRRGRAHLAFTWNGSARSNSCEAAVRLGEGSSVSGCDACVYPGTPEPHAERATATSSPSRW